MADTCTLKVAGDEVDNSFYCPLILSFFCFAQALLLMMRNIDNVYMCPNIRVRGHLCKTNLPSMSPTRAMGKAQGMAVTETIMNHVGLFLGVSGEKVKYSPLRILHAHI